MEAKESCIFYADWLKGIEALEDDTQKWMLCRYILQYSLTGEELYLPSTLKPLAAMIKPQSDRAQEKRERIIEKRREAGRNHKGNQYTKIQQNGTNGTLVPTLEQNGTNGTIDVSVSGSVSVEDKSSFKNTPPTPPMGEEAGEELKGFGIFFNKVNKIQVPEKVVESTYEPQYIWRMAEGNPGFAKAVDQAIDETTSKESFKSAMQQICKRYKPSTEFGAVKVCMAMKDLKPSVQADIVREINRARGEPDIYNTMLGKIEHIKSGAKIKNMASFLRNRQ